MRIINSRDIMETIEMLTAENLDVRTVTMGISLLDCIDPDPDKACEKIYNKITRLAGNLVPVVNGISEEYGIPIVNKRISVTPIAMLLGAAPDADPVQYAKTLDRAAKAVGVNFIGGFFDLSLGMNATNALVAGVLGIPGLVLRTSLITGLPYEDEAAFEELCDFLGEQKLQRVGAFAYSPEEGTPAAKMLNRVDADEAQRRAELVMEVQSQVMDQFNDSRMGDTVEVLCDGWDGQSMSYVGRSYAESPGIDGSIYFTSDSPVEAGDFVRVRITGAMDGELTGERTEE